MAEQNNNESTVEAKEQTQAASGVIVNAAQMQSLDISDRFIRTKTATGWQIKLEATARITINFMTSMRKFEITLMQNDVIERDADDLILIRTQPADAYRSQRGVSSSPLARGNERTPASEPTEGRTV
ncbi:MAG: hypothetical protein OXD49_05255 [Candidatus Poribacteria bacterium]|nr:hypothetical protein [Candidatus Poribacteria bacterium]